jgi:uncharacterized protein (TIGR02145 family)
MAVTVIMSVCVSGVSAQGTSGAGTFTDKRDGKAYRTVKMPDGKTWMAQNLNYQPQSGKSWCYDNNNSNCDQYGRLYDWNTAKKACPAGWHLPTTKEWDNMMLAAGGKKGTVTDEMEEGRYDAWLGVGMKLRSKTGWAVEDDCDECKGTDDYGFSVLPGGSKQGEIFGGVFIWGGGTGTESGNWWTATEGGKGTADRISTGGLGTGGINDHINMKVGKDSGNSVRCIQD